MMNSGDTDTAKLHILAEIAGIFFDELQRTKKGKAKILYEEEEDEVQVERLFDCVPRKARSSLKKSDYESFNGASTSSPSSVLPDLNKTLPWSPSSLTNNKKKNPRNPSSETKHTSRKRRAVQVTGKSKKAKVTHLSWKGRGTPESLLKVIRALNVADQDPKLIFERGLFKTDVDPQQSRLSMPISQIIRNDFLNPEEVDILQQDIDHGSKVGVGAFLVNEKAQMWRVNLKRWESQTSWTYSVTGGWNDFVAANGLEVESGISVWTFRWNGLICFAIISPPKKE